MSTYFRTGQTIHKEYAKIGPPIPDKGHNDCKSIWDEIFEKILIPAVIPIPISAITAIATLMTGKKKSDNVDLNKVFDGISNSLKKSIILPSGQLFYFKNPSIDSAGNFYLQLTYKSQN